MTAAWGDTDSRSKVSFASAGEFEDSASDAEICGAAVVGGRGDCSAPATSIVSGVTKRAADRDMTARKPAKITLWRVFTT